MPKQSKVVKHPDDLPPSVSMADRLTDEQMTEAADSAVASTEASMPEAVVNEAAGSDPLDALPAGTLFGVWDSEVGTWVALTTNAVFATTDLRLARAQLAWVATKYPHEPGRHSVVPMS